MSSLAGNDTFTNVGTADVVHGGSGDDTVRIHSGDFASVDGDLGIDTLVMDGKAMHIDLSALGKCRASRSSTWARAATRWR
ncbi:hypothetical protein [Variovorax boronicumulans]